MTRFVTTPLGARLAWDEIGTGSLVLLVHGIGYTRAKWEPQVQALAARDYRVVRYDLRGFGESESPPARASMSDYLSDLGAVVEAAALERFHLVGHSLGGMIAQRYAIENSERVRSLVLVSTTSHNGRRATAFARLMAQFAEHGFDRVMADERLRTVAESTLGEAFPSGVPLSMLRPGMEEPNLARENAWRACVDFSTKEQLSTLRCPVLVAHGTADRLIPFRAGELVHQAIAGSEWLVEEGAGHSLPKQRADTFNRALLDFLLRAEERV